MRKPSTKTQSLFVCDPSDYEMGAFEIRLDHPYHDILTDEGKVFYSLAWHTIDGLEPYGPIITEAFFEKLAAMDKAEAYWTLYHFEADLGSMDSSDFQIFQDTLQNGEEVIALMYFKGNTLKTVRTDLTKDDLEYYITLVDLCDGDSQIEFCLNLAYEVGANLHELDEYDMQLVSK